MNNKVFIMLALLLICCVGLLSIKKPIKTERFENNIRNKNPREHKHPDDISAAVEKLNKEINSLENTNPDVKPIDLNKIKPKETKPEKNTGFCIDKPNYSTQLNQQFYFLLLKMLSYLNCHKNISYYLLNMYFHSIDYFH